MKISRKIILITGGAVRIGRAISKLIANSGGILYCHYHKSEKQAFSLKDEIEGTGGKINLIHGNLADFNFRQKLISMVVQQSGQIDVLINNAAIFFKDPLESISEEKWDQLFTINLKAPFFLAQQAGLAMKKKGFGKIINIGDTSGLNPWPGYLAYSITKSGIISMTKGLAKALAPEVTVNCINPGPVLIPEYYSEVETKNAIDKTLLKRAGSEEDIAQTVKYVIEGTDYLTGSMINVDGGRSIY